MSKVQRFEDLKCWQAARLLVKEIFLACDEGKLAKDFDTKGQLKRAALATMNNIAEGFGRFSKKDFVRFLDFSQSSAQEVLSMLYVLSDLNYLTEEKIMLLRQLAEDTRNPTLALIKYLRVRIDEDLNTSTPQHHNTK